MTREAIGSLLVVGILSAFSVALAAEVLHPFEDHRAHLWGYRNSKGNVVIKPRFLAAEGFSPYDLAAVADGSGWKYINRHGKVIIEPFVVDNGPDPFREGLARCRLAGKIGFFNQRGEVVIPAALDFAEPFSCGRAAFCEGCRQFEEGEHHVYRGGRWGFINRRGAIVIPPRFEEARPFEGGRARVLLHGQWVSITPQGTPAE